MTWTPHRDHPGEQPHSWTAEIAPGVELVRINWNATVEHVYVRVDGCDLEPLTAQIHKAMRREKIALLVRNLARCGGRFEGAELPSEGEAEEPQGVLL